MDSCDVLIVGGGPAGSSCAWKLTGAGLDVIVMEKSRFPRDKVCGGWITPAVLEELKIDPLAYLQGRVFQPITGFRTSRMGDDDVETDYGRPVSYGIRRFEFDHFLASRSGARFREGVSLTGLERSNDGWLVNGEIKTRLVIGAGGHFCPVARFMGAKLRGEPIVAAQEAEFEMDARQQEECRIRSEVPELYFSPDLKGYGWAFRKGTFLNIGLGRLDPHQLSQHVAGFLNFLKRAEKVPEDIPSSLPGHAYLLYGLGGRNLIADGMMLAGDAAGLAYWKSGEGIRPAIESGLLAAQAVIAARWKYNRENLEPYRALIASRFGTSETDWSNTLSRRLPDALAGFIARKLFATRWFSRHVLLNRWFLHSHQPALNLC